MTEKSTFGSRPEQLKRLLTVIGLEKPGTRKNRDGSASAVSLLRPPGSRIERYKLLRVLGEGGMGVVYLAEQEQPIRRQVALKVIKPGMDSARVIARFEAERQALALLDHPNIAHVHDAGTTENGRPYFVMEYVEGPSITDHCDEYRLGIEDRLDLFLQVCHAVQYAHQKGIIHRDIKPSNLLVTMRGGRAVPKVIDFGVARAINEPLTERTLYTQQGQLLGTPEYMSPEQAEMVNEDIDTRSDVYSLGVLLYVLLTGALPFDPRVLREGGLDRIRRTIREEAPRTPSKRLSSLGERARTVARERRTEPVALARRLRRELEWIPLKALRKEREHRYQSVSELAGDIQNYVRGVPVTAGPESAAYRCRKFVQRHKALAAGVTAVLVALTGGILVSTLFALGQARARADAERQSEISEAVSDFLRNGLLASIDPHIAMGRELSVRLLLDTAAQELEGRFEDKPLVEASIRLTLADTYRNLCAFKEAQYNQMRALEIYREQLGEEHPEMFRCQYELGLLYWRQGRYNEGEAVFSKAVEGSIRVLGREHASTLSQMNGLGLMYWLQGRYQKAESLYLEILEISPRAVGNPPDANRDIGADDRKGPTLTYKGNLALVYGHQGRYAEAESLFLETLESGRRIWGRDHPFTLDLLGLGMVYRDWGRHDQAEAVLTEALEGKRRVLGAEHTYTLWAMNELARLYIMRARYDEAEFLLIDALEVGRRVSGEDHPFTLSSANSLGVLRRDQGRYGEAKFLLDEALAGRKRTLGPDHPACFEPLHELAVLHVRQGDYEDAEPLLLNAFHGRETKLGPDHPHTVESLNQLVILYEAWNKPEEAEKWRARLVVLGDSE